MDKVRVNGSKAHPVYLYLKKMTNPKHNVSWNFGSYFLVDPKGQVTLHPGTSPDELAPSVKRVIQETQPPSSSSSSSSCSYSVSFPCCFLLSTVCSFLQL